MADGGLATPSDVVRRRVAHRPRTARSCGRACADAVLGAHAQGAHAQGAHARQVRRTREGALELTLWVRMRRARTRQACERHQYGAPLRPWRYERAA
eukprot:4215796-Pleurochrysis_carterae.AAC.1